ncbi:MAG TPA: UDP-N-acetylglucosamine 2-epimerase [Solirubrobacterales bacterium]|nr:UDP-N-acetylglucosamine 2-epimerase [Solirubrobacterales bacterium]
MTDAPPEAPSASVAPALRDRAEVETVGVEQRAETELGRMAAAISRLEPPLADRQPAVVVAAGDGNAALGAALVAAKLGLPVARVGAGVRTGDRHDPAEVNRVVADHVCDLLLCAGERELDNLAREGLAYKAEVVIDAPGAGSATAAAIVAWAGSYTSGA